MTVLEKMFTKCCCEHFRKVPSYPSLWPMKNTNSVWSNILLIFVLSFEANGVRLLSLPINYNHKKKKRAEALVHLFQYLLTINLFKYMIILFYISLSIKDIFIYLYLFMVVFDIYKQSSDVGQSSDNWKIGILWNLISDVRKNTNKLLNIIIFLELHSNILTL